MPIFLSAYDTTFGRQYHTEQTKAAIVKAAVSNYLEKNPERFALVEGNDGSPIDVPSFSHPLYVNKDSYDGLYADVRPFVSRNRQTGELKVNSTSDYNMLLARAGLECIWRQQDPGSIRSMSVFPASVYSAWLAENIAKRFGIGPEDQYKLTAFAAWFYYSLFTEDLNPTDQDFLKISQAIAKATRIPADAIMLTLEDQPYVKDVTDFCARLEDVVGNVRLKGFSSIVLYPMLSSTWFGANSNEIVAVAIEHVPTFMAMITAAMTERAYARSNLSKMMERVPAKGNASEFLLQVTASLKS